MSKIVIRPSSIGSLVSCPRQWYHVHVLGIKTIPSVRAAIGTGVHAAAEAMWKESMTKKTKVTNLSAMKDAAVEAYDNEVKSCDGNMEYDEGVDDNAARELAISGVEAFAEDIVPFVPIPDAVETRVTIPIDHPMVECVSGSIDYLAGDTISDIKTSKRKVVPQSHTLQQSTYKLLAESSGHTINRNTIQSVVFGARGTVGGIDELDANIPQVKYIINNLLDKLDVLQEGKVDPEVLFPGNPKHYLCSDKYCKLRPTCPFVNGQK